MKKEIIISAAILGIIGCSTAGMLFLPKNAVDDEVFAEVAVNETQEEIVIPTVDADNKQIKRELSTPVSADNAAKADVWHMMLNSIDYYNNVSGTIVYSHGNADDVYLVDFQCDIPDSAAYSSCYLYSAGDAERIDPDELRNTESISNITNYCGDGHNIMILSDRTYREMDYAIIKPEDALPIADEDRVTVEADGNPGFHYRADPTNIDSSSMCIFPQVFAMGFLYDTDLWEINGIVDYNGHECWQISGCTSPEYGAKLNVEEFDFLVDTKTGVLMKYEGRDKEGNLTDYMYSDNIKFGKDAESVKRFHREMLRGYRENNLS